MCRPICSPMAPSPIMPVRFTLSCPISTSSIHSCVVCLHLLSARRGRGRIDRSPPPAALEDDAILALGRLRRDIALLDVVEHALRIARERIAVAAAALRVEPKYVAFAQRIIRVASRQPLGLRRTGIDPDIAGPSSAATGAAVGRNQMLHGADGKAGVLEIEIFAHDAEPAAEAAGAAGIPDQLEAQQPRGKFAFDDLDGGDHGVALIDGDAGGAVLAGARPGAA